MGGLEITHDDDGHGLVVQVNDGNVRGAVSVRSLQRLGFVSYSLLRQRPVFADATDVRKTLLDDDGDARAVIDDVDEVDVAVADFLGAPLGLTLGAAERRGHPGLRRTVVQHGGGVESDKPGGPGGGMRRRVRLVTF